MNNLFLESRSPCGERGLKSIDVFCSFVGSNVAPRAGSVD